MIWRLTQSSQEAERLSRELVALSFFALAAWMLWNAIQDLRSHEAPAVSWPGIGLAVLSLAVMPLIARANREVGFGLGSAAIVADSRQASLRAYLSALLLGGLLLHALLGWWRVDAAASLAMTPIIISEGVDAWRGDACGCGP